MPLIRSSGLGRGRLVLGDQLERGVGEDHERRHALVAGPRLAPLAEALEQRPRRTTRGSRRSARASSRRRWPAAGRTRGSSRPCGCGPAARRHPLLVGQQRVEEAGRLARGAAAGVARQRPRQREVGAGAGHADVEQPALLLDRGRGVGVRDRQGAVLEAAEEDRVPLQALGGVEGGQGDAVGDRGVLLGGAAVEVVDEVAERGSRAPWRTPWPGRPAPARTPSGPGSGRAWWAPGWSSPCPTGCRARSRGTRRPPPSGPRRGAG